MILILMKRCREIPTRQCLTTYVTKCQDPITQEVVIIIITINIISINIIIITMTDITFITKVCFNLPSSVCTTLKLPVQKQVCKVPPFSFLCPSLCLSLSVCLSVSLSVVCKVPLFPYPLPVPLFIITFTIIRIR